MDFPLIGNKRVLKIINTMAVNRRIPHAVIIEGEAGLGKKTLAKYIAKAIICESDNPPCCSCKSCHLIDVGSHQDYCVYEPSKAKYTVDEVRELRTDAYYAPIMANKRVFVIDRAELLPETAQNILLKVIEEPPAQSNFIFLCSNALSLLNTIRSRCVCFSLLSVDIDDDSVQTVSRLAESDNEIARSALIKSGGNIGKTFQSISSGDNTVTGAEILELASKSGRYELLRALQPLVKKRELIHPLLLDIKYNVTCEINKKAANGYSPFTFEKLDSIIKMTETIEESLPFNPSTALTVCLIADAF